MSNYNSNDTWAFEVGKFVLAFGRIELATYWAIDGLVQSELVRYIRDKQLGERIDVLLLFTQDKDDAGWSKFKAALLDAKKLVKDRHLIAHNDLWVDVLDSGAYEQKIISGRDSMRAMNFETLKRKRADAEKLASRLMDSLEYVLEPYRTMRGLNDPK